MHETYLPLDAREILARLDAGEIPANWRVFRTNRKQLIGLIIGFCTTVLFIIGLLIFYLLTNFNHPPVPSKVLYIVGIMQLCFLLLTAIVSLFTWISMKDIVYVFTPFCLIRRNYKRQKKIFSVNYRDIVAICEAWNVAIVEIEGKRQRKALRCQFLEPPVDEALFTFEKMYEAFQAEKAELSLKPEASSTQIEEAISETRQPPIGYRNASRMYMLIFLGEVLFYIGVLLASTRSHFPSDFLAWTAWTIAGIACFLLTEGPILLLAIALRKRAAQLLRDERLNTESETIQTRRLLRRALSLWQFHYFLSHPMFTSLIPLCIMLFCQPLQRWLQDQIQAASHGNPLALLILALICLLNSLAVIPFIQVHRWFVHTARSTDDQQNETLPCVC